MSITLLIIGATTNANGHYWWMVAAMASHHAYDIMVYFAIMFPKSSMFGDVSQNWAVFWNTLAIILGFTCCVRTCDAKDAPFFSGWEIED